MILETVTTTAVNAVKLFFAPARAAWKVIPRVGKALLIAIAMYLTIAVLSVIPSLVAPLVGIGLLWAAAYVFLGSRAAARLKSSKQETPK